MWFYKYQTLCGRIIVMAANSVTILSQHSKPQHMAWHHGGLSNFCHLRPMKGSPLLRPPPKNLQHFAIFLDSAYTVRFTLRPCTLFSRSTFRSVSSSSCLRAEASCLSRSLISPRILYNHNHILIHHLPGLHGISKGRFSRLFATMQTTATHVPIGHDCVIPKSRIFAAGNLLRVVLPIHSVSIITTRVI